MNNILKKTGAIAANLTEEMREAYNALRQPVDRKNAIPESLKIIKDWYLNPSHRAGKFLITALICTSSLTLVQVGKNVLFEKNTPTAEVASQFKEIQSDDGAVYRLLNALKEKDKYGELNDLLPDEDKGKMLYSFGKYSMPSWITVEQDSLGNKFAIVNAKHPDNNYGIKTLDDFANSEDAQKIEKLKNLSRTYRLLDERGVFEDSTATQDNVIKTIVAEKYGWRFVENFEEPQKSSNEQIAITGQIRAYCKNQKITFESFLESDSLQNNFATTNASFLKNFFLEEPQSFKTRLFERNSDGQDIESTNRTIRITSGLLKNCKNVDALIKILEKDLLEHVENYKNPKNSPSEIISISGSLNEHAQKNKIELIKLITSDTKQTRSDTLHNYFDSNFEYLDNKKIKTLDKLIEYCKTNQDKILESVAKNQEVTQLINTPAKNNISAEEITKTILSFSKTQNIIDDTIYEMQQYAKDNKGVDWEEDTYKLIEKKAEALENAQAPEPVENDAAESITSKGGKTVLNLKLLEHQKDFSDDNNRRTTLRDGLFNKAMVFEGKDFSEINELEFFKDAYSKSNIKGNDLKFFSELVLMHTPAFKQQSTIRNLVESAEGSFSKKFKGEKGDFIILQNSESSWKIGLVEEIDNKGGKILYFNSDNELKNKYFDFEKSNGKRTITNDNNENFEVIGSISIEKYLKNVGIKTVTENSKNKTDLEKYTNIIRFLETGGVTPEKAYCYTIHSDKAYGAEGTMIYNLEIMGLVKISGCSKSERKDIHKKNKFDSKYVEFTELAKALGVEKKEDILGNVEFHKFQSAATIALNADYWLDTYKHLIGKKAKYTNKNGDDKTCVISEAAILAAMHRRPGTLEDIADHIREKEPIVDQRKFYNGYRQACNYVIKFSELMPHENGLDITKQAIDSLKGIIKDLDLSKDATEKIRKIIKGCEKACKNDKALSSNFETPKPEVTTKKEPEGANLNKGVAIG